MEALQARLDSFKPKRTKAGKASSSKYIEWPHPSTFKANPNTLAAAGFYYDPSPQYRDSVTCYMCGKELSEWTKNDDPFAIHWSKCKTTCAWATVRCGLVEDVDEDGNYVFPNPSRLPTSKTMEKARLETFTVLETWPHDSTKGHGANSKKMAKAGFVFTPQMEGDDTATCFYCRKSLSGWDEDDDPLEEHHKREIKSGIPCPFFASNNKSSVQLGKSTSKPPSRVTSKPPSRVVSQSKKAKPKSTEQDEPPSESEDELAGATVTNPKGKAATKGKGSTSRASSAPTSKTKTPASRRSTRTGGGASGKSLTQSAAASEVEDENETEASGSEAGRRVSKSKRKAPSRAKERIEAIEEEDEGSQGQDEKEELEEPKATEKPKRGRPPKARAAGGKGKKLAAEKENDMEDADMEVAPAPSDPTHSRTRSKANLESESDVPGPSKLGSSRSGTRVKSGSSSRSKKKAAQEAEDHMREVQPPSEPSHPQKSKVNGKSKVERVATAKSRKAAQSESEIEDRHTALDEPRKTAEEPPQQPHALSTIKSKATQESQNLVPLKGDKDKLKTRKSSTTSDDAGYATAELPMDVDEALSPLDPPPVKRAPVLAPSPPGHSADVINEKPGGLDKGTGESDVDMDEPQATADRDSGLPESIHPSSPRPDVPEPRKQSPHSRVGQPQARPLSRAGTSLSRRITSLGTKGGAEMQVVTISSDEEDEPVPPPPEKAKKSSTFLPNKDKPSAAPGPRASKLSAAHRDGDAVAIEVSSDDEQQARLVYAMKDDKQAVPAAKSNKHPTHDFEAVPALLPDVKPSTSSAASHSAKAKKAVKMEVVLPPLPSKKVKKKASALDVEMRDPEDRGALDHKEPAVNINGKTARPHSPIATPPRTVSPSASPPPNAPPAVPEIVLPSFDDEMDGTAMQASSSPASFTPFLALMPMHKITSLTEEESTLTIEQYIRREMEIQYQQFKEDAERRIALFREKAAETRRVIEAS